MEHEIAIGMEKLFFEGGTAALDAAFLPLRGSDGYRCDESVAVCISIAQLCQMAAP